MQFAILYLDKEDAGDIRDKYREPHIDSRRALVPNHLLYAGPLLSENGKEMIGGLLIVEAENRRQAETIANADPYVEAGLFKSITIHPHSVGYAAMPAGVPGPESALDNPQAFEGYTPFLFSHGKWSRKVWRKGSGPAVIIMHEMPNLHPLVMRFADHVAEAGMTVYCPSLLGKDGMVASFDYLQNQIKGMCVRHEFAGMVKGASSPIVDWFRALAKKAYAECGGRGVGAVGMCLTGGYGLAMMTEPEVVAPVLSQPSCPGGEAGRGLIDASPEEISCAKRRLKEEDLTIMGLRNKADPFTPPERFQMLRETFGDRFIAVELEPEDANPDAPPPAPHSVLTWDIIDKPGTRSKQVEQDVIEFLRKRTYGA